MERAACARCASVTPPINRAVATARLASPISATMFSRRSREHDHCWQKPKFGNGERLAVPGQFLARQRDAGRQHARPRLSHGQQQLHQLPATANVTFNNTTVTVNNLLRMGRMGGGTVPPSATMNVAGGSLTVRSNVVIEGNAIINATNTTVTFVRPATLTMNTLVLDGASLSNNAGVIRSTNVLTIANNGSILGNPAFDLGNNGTANWSVQGAAGGGLTVNNSLAGRRQYQWQTCPGQRWQPGRRRKWYSGHIEYQRQSHAQPGHAPFRFVEHGCFRKRPDLHVRNGDAEWDQ